MIVLWSKLGNKESTANCKCQKQLSSLRWVREDQEPDKWRLPADSAINMNKYCLAIEIWLWYSLKICTRRNVGKLSIGVKSLSLIIEVYESGVVVTQNFLRKDLQNSWDQKVCGSIRGQNLDFHSLISIVEVFGLTRLLANASLSRVRLKYNDEAYESDERLGRKKWEPQRGG